MVSGAFATGSSSVYVSQLVSHVTKPRLDLARDLSSASPMVDETGHPMDRSRVTTHLVYVSSVRECRHGSHVQPVPGVLVQALPIFSPPHASPSREVPVKDGGVGGAYSSIFGQEGPGYVGM